MSAKLTPEEIERHDKTYSQAWSLIKDEIFLHGRTLPNKPDLRKLKKATSLFEQTLKLNPRNWSAMWALGKIYQRLNDNLTALNWFSEAHKVEPDNPEMLREAALCAMNLGNASMAVELAASALELKPRDPGLVSNLVLALLLDGRTEEARGQAKKIAEANRDDETARSVLQLLEDVESGKTPEPKNSS